MVPSGAPKTKSYTRLYSCSHGRRLDVLPFLEPVTAAFGIPEDSLATTPVECIVDTLQDQDLELSQQDIEHIAGFMVEMRSRMSTGTRLIAVAEIGICVFEHINGCVLDIPPTDSRTMDSEVRRSESDLEDNAVKSLLARMRYEYKNGIGDDNCSICLGKFFEGDDELAKTPCSHMFHQDCLGTWFIRRNNCPLCRRDIQF
ncbi:hypothetical protein QQ045_000040 [Rhodiola kirilowii]